MEYSELLKIAKKKQRNFGLKCIVDLPQNIRKAYDLPSKNELNQIAEKLEINVKNIYFVNDILFYFFDGLTSCRIMLDKNQLNHYKKIIKDTLKRGKMCLEEDNFETHFMFLDKPLICNVFFSLFDIIPDDQKYEIFRDIYIELENAYESFEKSRIIDIMKYRTKEVIDEIKINIKNIDSNGYVTVYRGNGSRSTDPQIAYSWTLNLNTAIFFSLRYDKQDTTVYQAKIHIDDIYDYFADRGEAEIFLIPEKLVNIKPIDFIDLSKIRSTLEDAGIYTFINNYEKKILSEHYNRPYGIHGVEHTKRVLLLLNILCYYEKLPREDVRLLSQVSLYHDIGREDDEECKNHGYQSYEKALSLGVMKNGETDNDKILQFIIENHCISDKQAIENLNKYDITDISRAIKLFNVFKDADGLDRARIKDIDIKYFRLEISKKLPYLAYQLNRF